MAFFAPIVLILVLALAAAYFLVLRRASREGKAWRVVAWTGVVLGIIALTLTALAAVLSFSPWLDWIKSTPLLGPLGVASFLSVPVALAGLAFGGLGLMSESRAPAIVGLALSAASIVGWIAMLTIAG